MAKHDIENVVLIFFRDKTTSMAFPGLSPLINLSNIHIIEKTTFSHVLFFLDGSSHFGDTELHRHWLTPTMKHRFILCK